MEERMTRFLLAIVRNCGVAIAISVFFAAARGPAHPAGPGAVHAAAAKSSELTAQAKAAGCDRAWHSPDVAGACTH
jgi:hypothetical protein